MRVTHAHHHIRDQSRLDRITDHRRRIDKAMSYQRNKHKPKAERHTRLDMLLARIDRIDAMGSNWGFSHS